MGTVEGKVAGGQRGETDAALRAGQPFGEDLFLWRGADGLHQRHQHALALAQGQFHRIGQSGADGFAQHQPVHHQFDRMCPAFVERRQGVEIGDLAIHPRPHKALAAGGVEDLQMGALASTHQRGEQRQAGAFGPFQQRAHDLRRALRGDQAAAARTVRHAGMGPKQA